MDYAARSENVKKHDRAIAGLILDIHSSEAEHFQELARREFELQYRAIPSYRRRCRNIGVLPQDINSWEEIPAVCLPSLRKTISGHMTAWEAEQTLRSGNMVSRPQKIARAYLGKEYAALSKAAVDRAAGSSLFADGQRLKILTLLPPPTMAPGMVMAAGSKRIMKRFGTPDSRFLVSLQGLDLKGLLNALSSAEKNEEKLALIGDTRSLDNLFNACLQAGINYSLPEGSRICDSGGYTGRYQETSPAEFYEKCNKVLGIEEKNCFNALWLCGLNTVFFDNTPEKGSTDGKVPRCKKSPAWTRTIAVDTRKFKRVPQGEIGLLRHYDLSNRAISIGVQTDILGFETDCGFEVTGKWGGTPGKPELVGQEEHPGGKITTRIIDFLMGRQFSKISSFYSAPKKIK